MSKASSVAAGESLTVAEIAKRPKLNQQTSRNMIDRGELGAVRLGQRRVRVRQSQLDASLAAGETPARAPLRRDDDAAEPWQAVGTAVEAAIRAVNAEDRDALDSAIVASLEAGEPLQVHDTGGQA